MRVFCLFVFSLALSREEEEENGAKCGKRARRLYFIEKRLCAHRIINTRRPRGFRVAVHFCCKRRADEILRGVRIRQL